ncbi:hypothetical protein [Mesorhizobium erdmanii]|uniref:hypothetical protein n=1 Tax=Mesorhizobium erdmanii TaxID=1777866 RepID=UPI0012B52C6F|nr:hypothetical protein [Mesorhizobium erdmanii]
MVSKDVAEKWIAEMEADSGLAAIRTEVEEAYAVSVGFANGPEWEAQVKGKTAVIRVAENRPSARFIRSRAFPSRLRERNSRNSTSGCERRRLLKLHVSQPHRMAASTFSFIGVASDPAPNRDRVSDDLLGCVFSTTLMRSIFPLHFAKPHH